MENPTFIHKQRYPSPHSEIKLYIVTYLSQGLRVKGLLAEPTWGGRYPGLLYLRGGIKQVGKVRVARIIQFASRGFVVLAPYYRGNEDGEGHEDFCMEDRYDAYEGLAVLGSHSVVDTDSLHVFGFSRGGAMALFTAAHFPDIVKSVVVWGGLSDMKLTYEERTDLRKMLKRAVGGSVYKYPERYENRTPLSVVGSIRAPVLVIHGIHDENVGFEHALRLEEALKRHEKSYVTWYFEDDHHFSPRKKRQVTHELLKWMLRNV
ncbi:S9 family peptidase [Alkalihalobacillus sp. AL-G]|uniref:alpha/beta hydrolase family protein n=1 Tax=Alkalihalobacillus sp. AL-G TaxID=2926399 RepID=UPI00272B4158|nr:prolyl oligopeptidase family serine peptidase [Alkalihalobacillus sp. AL-G]WLD92459.1 prolyl oligopeptidase family serine peptidase [Alkalihalobacillus sp. AL-G]